MKIKRGDLVVVVVGDEAGPVKEKPNGDRPAPHRVSQVLDGGRQVVIEQVNLVYKHVRRGHPKSPQGGRLRLEMPIRSSNVMFYCEHCQRGVRLGLRFAADGSKERFCRKCKKSVGQVSPARERSAGK
jgi:large subunit ribosomal protein L24